MAASVALAFQDMLLAEDRRRADAAKADRALARRQQETCAEQVSVGLPLAASATGLDSNHFVCAGVAIWGYSGPVLAWPMYPTARSLPQPVSRALG
jgi:hypothetical protein